MFQSASQGYLVDQFRELSIDIDCAVNAVYKQPAAKYEQLERVRESSVAPIIGSLPELKKILEGTGVPGDTAALLRLDSRTLPLLSIILGPTFGSGLSLLPTPSIEKIKSAAYQNLWSEIKKIGLQPRLCWDKHTDDTWSGHGTQRLILCVSLPDSRNANLKG